MRSCGCGGVDGSGDGGWEGLLGGKANKAGPAESRGLRGDDINSALCCFYSGCGGTEHRAPPLTRTSRFVLR